jgi:hypothetical protein
VDLDPVRGQEPGNSSVEVRNLSDGKGH